MSTLRIKRTMIAWATFLLIPLLGLIAMPALVSATTSYGWGGGTQTATNVDGTVALYGVSCPTASFCMAVGGETEGYVASYSSGTWTTFAGNPVSTAGPLISVSCPSTSFCVAGDTVGDVYYYNSGAWTADGANPIGLGALQSVSCPTTTFCMAVDDNGNAFSYDGASWTAYGTNPIDSGNQLDSVSCPTETDCVAVDNVGNAFEFTSGTWSPDAANPIDSGIAFTSISCPTTTFCAAADDDSDVFTDVSGTWSANATNPLDSAGSGGSDYTSVSCPSSSSCMAVDNNDAGYSFASGSWTAYASNPIDDAGTDGAVYAVSCASATFCMAVSDASDAVSYGVLPTDTITFNSEGGSPVTAISGGIGSTVNAPTSPTYAGHTFDGWFTTPNGSTAVSFPYTLLGSITFYAQWTPYNTPTMTLTASSTTVSSGGALTFTATVSGSSGTPTGTVDFSDPGVSLPGCSAVGLVSGTAQCTTRDLATGTDVVEASYSGNIGYTVASADTTVTVTAVPIPATGLRSAVLPSPISPLLIFLGGGIGTWALIGRRKTGRTRELDPSSAVVVRWL